MITKYITRIFWGERLEWNVNLTPEQVLSLIGTKNEGSWFDRIFAPGIGTRTGNHKFTLAKMNIGNLPMSRNSFVHVLAGRVYETSTGSRVVAQFRLFLPVFVFVTVWFGLTFIIGIGEGITILYKAISTGDMGQLRDAMMMFLAPLIGTAFFNLFRLFGSGNEEELKETLDNLLAPHAI
ncbi:MAG: hypothetical protein ACXWRE_01285 [Pseudobdellovibrionaceae bacterium]